jgi:TolB-like protein/Tfp pilus assembly protein PilF
MPEKSDNPFQFWQELKRRKVIRVIIGYLAAGYVILELTSIIADPFGLPGWTIKLVFILLCVGFIIAILLSWIFDITPDGIRKTGSQNAVKNKTKPKSGKRKLKTSDVIIAALLVAVCILAFPRIFNNDKLDDIRDEEGKISVAVMPFENLSGDSLLNVWQDGFQNLLISTLSNSDELQVRQFQTMSSIMNQKKSVHQASMSPSLVREIALNLETRTFITGKILKAGDKVRVNAQLVNAESEEIYKTYQIDWNDDDDVFVMADSLSGLIRNYLEIKKLIEAYNSPGITQLSFTNSAEAFQYYLHGWDAVGKMDLQSAVGWLSKAIEIDSGFVNAYIFLSFTLVAGGENKLSKIWCEKAYNKREKLPVREKLYLDHLYAYHYETPREEIYFCKQILEIDEMNTNYWHFLGDAYYRLNQYREATVVWENLLDIHEKWGTGFGIPYFYSWMGESLHKLGDHERENEVYKIGLKALPNTTMIIERQAACALSQGEMVEAEKYIDEYKTIGTIYSWSESLILARVGSTYSIAGLIDEAENYYRQALELDPGNLERMHDLAWHLIDHDIDIDEGVKLVEKSLEIKPGNSYILDTYGWGLYKQGKYEEALKVLNKSWELRGPYDPVIYEHIRETEKALATSTTDET